MTWELEQERAAQVALGFTAEHDDTLTPSQWISILARHVGLAADDGGGHDPVRFRRQLRRIAATALAAMQSFDRTHPPEKVAILSREGHEGRR